MANMVQAFPTLSAMELREIIIRSASQFENPDSQLGYGIPNYLKAKSIANLDVLRSNMEGNVLIYPNPLQGSDQLQILLKEDSQQNNVIVSISDMRGRVLYESSFGSSFFSLPLESDSFVPGTYTVRVMTNENEVDSQKIVIH